MGDLLEGFATRQSRFWLWREVIAAIVTRALQPQDHEHPLGLADGIDAVRDEPSAAGSHPITLAASPLPGTGGLVLFALVLITALAGAQVWWFFVPALAGGAVLGLVMTLYRRRAVLSPPAGSSRMLTRTTEGAGRAT